MKFKIKREILLEGLNKVSKAISTKNLIPVLAGIKFDLKGKSLTLTASDNDITIQNKINAKKDEFIIEDEGSIIIQGRYVLDIARKLTDEFINFEVIDDLKVIISTENSEFNLNGISEREYPTINLEESKNKVYLSSNLLKDIVYETAFAASNEENKPVLTGINFNIAGNMMECNATDSYRLARKVITLDKESSENYNIVVPRHNIVELSKILSSEDEQIELNIFSNKILFKLDNLLFQSRLINGTYPNTSNLLPKEDFMNITMNLLDFYSVIDRVSILTSDKDKNIVNLETNGDVLTLKSSSAEIGKVEEKMNITKNNKKDIKISFSAKYMMEALKSFSTEDVEIHFIGEIKPIIIKSKDKEDLTQLVLPIRTY
ncbi:MAG: DNA polymerase III subunit beta [Bacilli bacterium]|nr:DNA polymerase III subunit beta [Bacilli bacterium]